MPTVLPAVAVGAAALVDAGFRKVAPDALAQARSGWSGWQLAAAGVVMVLVVGLGTALTFLTPVNRVAIFVSVGASMLLAAARGYDGCELLAVPNLVLRRRGALWCPLYTPIDAAERANRPAARCTGGER